MANEKQVTVLVLPRCGVAYGDNLYAQGSVFQADEKTAKAWAADAPGNQTVVQVVKDAKEGGELYKKLRRDYFKEEHGNRKGDQMPNEEQLSKLYGGVAA